MNAIHSSRHPLAFIAAFTMLAGCGELQQPQSSVPSGAQSSLHRNAVQRPMPESTWVPMSVHNPTRVGWLSPAAKVRGARLLYVSQYSEYPCSYYCVAASVLIYPEKGNNQSPIGMIPLPGEPWGLFVDKHHSLFVTNQSGMVYKYPP